jgi:integrase
MGKKPIQRIRAMNIEDLLIKKGQELNKSSVQLIRVIFTGVFKRAMLEEIVKINPCSALSATPGKEVIKDEKENVHRKLSPEELSIFLEEAESVNDWYLLFYRFMLCMGTRCGEAAAVELRDIDMKNNVIHIRRTATVDDDGKRIIGTSAKTKTGNRDIPITPEVAEIIKAQRKINSGLFGKMSEQFESRLFYSEYGKIITPQNVNTRIERTIAHYNAKHPDEKLKRFSSHSFRDTFASKKVMDEHVDIKTVSVLLGHSSTKITYDKYVKISDEEKVKAMQTA